MNSVFLKIEGITGESKDTSHQGWIDIDSYSRGVRRSGEGKGPGKANYHNLTVHCQVDKATAPALLYASNGNRISQVELSACKAGGEQIEYYRVTLEGVIITEVLLRDSSMSADVEYAFQADKVKFQYWEQSTLGVKGAENRMGWDIKNSQSCF